MKNQQIKREICKIAVAMFGSIALSTTVTNAAVIWYYGNNNVSGLTAQTGQSSDGGLPVDWKDTTLRVYDPDTPWGNNDPYVAVQQYRTIPPIWNHGLFSFNDVFGSGLNQVHSPDGIISAYLWVYAVQALNNSQTITIAGLARSDASWGESTATYNHADGINPWFGGGNFSGATITNYSTFPTHVQPSGEWLHLDVTDALKDYARGNIGGIALLASGTPTTEIRNLYLASDEYGISDLRPGLLVTTPEPSQIGIVAGMALLAGALTRKWKANRAVLSQ